MSILRRAVPLSDQQFGAAQQAVDRGAAFVASLITLAVVVLGLLLIYGARGGSTFTHASQAQDAALFSGPAVTAAETAAANAILTCGRSTHTIEALAFTTDPFQVHSVTSGPALKGNQSATGARNLTSCLTLHWASNVNAQISLNEASASVGLNAANLRAWAETLGLGASKSGGKL